ncbi:MAG: tetratricopeptide repeat protein [Treponemataceae bacterium]
MSLHSESALRQAYENLVSFDPDGAKILLSQALVDDLDNAEIMFCLKIINFWSDQKRAILANQEFFFQGELLIKSWKKFVIYFKTEIPKYEQCVYSIQKGAFSFALDVFKQTLQLATSNQKALIFNRIGICHKQLGNYETALTFFEQSDALLPCDAQNLADMADCYALCGNERDSKILFREAFFIDPQYVDVSLIESELFTRLYNKVALSKKTSEEIAEWIPVEGTILHIFDCKRKLRAIEIGQLKQNIYALETELKDSGCQRELLIPRLINKYFWLIDHYIMENDHHSKINETLLKIKLLDEDIYQRYTV